MKKLMIAALLAFVPIGLHAGTMIDATFDVDPSNPTWQSTAIQVEPGDTVYLFGFGAGYGADPHSVRSVFGVGCGGEYNNNLNEPAPNLGQGLVAKIAGGDSFGIGSVVRRTASAAGTLFLGFNDSQHGDNAGSYIVGMLIFRGTGGTLIDTTFDVDAATSAWQPTPCQIQADDKLYLLGFGACYGDDVRHVSHVMGAGTPGNGTNNPINQPAPGLGEGLVVKIAGNDSFGISCVAGRVAVSSGTLNLAFNDNPHTDNSGSFPVGILIARGFTVLGTAEQPGAPLSSRLRLAGWPNPTSRGLDINYEIPKRSNAKLTVVDKSGRVVAALLDESASAGKYTLSWNGLDRKGNKVPAGTYFYSLSIDGSTATKEVVVVK